MANLTRNKVAHIVRICSVLLIALVLFTFQASSQVPFTVKGKIFDSTSQKSLPFATITAYRQSDTTVVAYQLSDLNGSFNLDKIFHDKIFVLITHTGFEVRRINIEFNDAKKSVDLGAINLNMDNRSLDEVLVIAERPPIIVYKDTIEFNAAAFKTLPNSLLEDLLKKLPGVTINRSGEILVNGKVVNKIVVEGKDFFGSDPLIATKNLPANIIDKVQVFDDGDDTDRNFGINSGTVGKVINLKLKKAVKKGVFGKAYAGLGTEDRYEFGCIANLFRDTTQLSLLAFSNNLNKPAFGMSDVKEIGGFSRSGYSSTMISRFGGFELDGISFGGTSEGIQRSSGAGINYNTELSNKTSVNFKYFYGNILNNVQDGNDIRQYLDGLFLYNKQLKRQQAKIISHKFGGKLTYKPSNSLVISVKPTVTTVQKNYNQSLVLKQTRNELEKVYESTNTQNDQSGLSSISNDLSLRFNVSNKRSFIFMNSVNINRNSDDNNVITSSKFFPSLTETTDQLKQTENTFSKINFYGSYSELLTPKMRLLLSQTAIFATYSKALNTLERPGGSFNYELLIKEQSGKGERKTFNTGTTVGLNFPISKVIVTANMEFRKLRIVSKYLGNSEIKFDKVYLLPSLNFNVNGIFLNYFTSVVEPPGSSMLPVVDNTNPLFLSQGNPKLEPVYSHGLYVTFDKYNLNKLLTYRFLFSLIVDENAVNPSKSIDGYGIETIKFVNSSANLRGRTSNSITKDIKISRDVLGSLTATFYADFLRYSLLINSTNTTQSIWNVTPQLSYNINFGEKLEIGQDYAFTFSEMESFVGSIRKSGYNHVYLTEVVARPVKKIVVEGSVHKYFNSGFNGGHSTKATFVNCAINYSTLAGERLNFRLSGFNLLDESDEVFQTINEFSTIEKQSKTIGRYFLFNITYNLSEFGKSKRGKDKLLLF